MAMAIISRRPPVGVTIPPRDIYRFTCAYISRRRLEEEEEVERSFGEERRGGEMSTLESSSVKH